MCLSRDAALSAPMLDIDEERSAIRLWQDHRDRRALETLVRAHARLAWSVARRWTDNPAHLEDLVAAGMIGLVRAAERFEQAASDLARLLEHEPVDAQAVDAARQQVRAFAGQGSP